MGEYLSRGVALLVGLLLLLQFFLTDGRLPRLILRQVEGRKDSSEHPAGFITQFQWLRQVVQFAPQHLVHENPGHDLVPPGPLTLAPIPRPPSPPPAAVLPLLPPGPRLPRAPPW